MFFSWLILEIASVVSMGAKEDDKGMGDVMGVGKGVPALCSPSCVSHRTISRDGAEREDDEDEDCVGNDDDDEEGSEPGVIEGGPVNAVPVLDPVLVLVKMRLPRDGDGDAGTGG